MWQYWVHRFLFHHLLEVVFLVLRLKGRREWAGGCMGHKMVKALFCTPLGAGGHWAVPTASGLPRKGW